MSRADSPLAGRMIFTVGARRSGTFWLQRVVTAHPEVAAVPTESHFFSHGIAPLFERFQHGARSSPQLGALYVDRDVLLDATRDFCDRIFGELFEPGAHFLAERTPLHALHLDLIASIYADASYIHIVRDGRDVARSLVKQSWGPETIAEAAEEWRASVTAARAGRPERYLEVRYEELLARPRESIEALYEWLGLEVTEAALEAALSEAGTSANLDPTDQRIQAAKWRAALSPRELADFDRVAGPLLAELGYQRASGGAEAGRAAPEDGHVRSTRASTRTHPPRWRERVRGRVLKLVPTARGRSPGPATTGGARPAGPDQVIHQATASFDRLLGHLQSGRPHAAGSLLDPEAKVVVVERGGTRAARDSAAREELLAEIASDPAFRGRQVRGDVLSGAPGFTAVLEHELPDGTRTERLVWARLRGGQVRSLAIYRLGSARESAAPAARAL